MNGPRLSSARVATPRVPSCGARKTPGSRPRCRSRTRSPDSRSAGSRAARNNSISGSLKRASVAVPGRVVVRGFFDPIGVAYAAAHVVVARAGAMTVSELCAWGKPSVLVPLPTAAADHQTFNARALANAGASVLLLEREFTPDAFAKTVVPLAADENRLDALARSARGRGHPNAARSIMEKVLALSQVE